MVRYEPIREGERMTIRGEHLSNLLEVGCVDCRSRDDWRVNGSG